MCFIVFYCNLQRSPLSSEWIFLSQTYICLLVPSYSNIRDQDGRSETNYTRQHDQEKRGENRGGGGGGWGLETLRGYQADHVENKLCTPKTLQVGSFSRPNNVPSLQTVSEKLGNQDSFGGALRYRQPSSCNFLSSYRIIKHTFRRKSYPRIVGCTSEM